MIYKGVHPVGLKFFLHFYLSFKPFYQFYKNIVFAITFFLSILPFPYNLYLSNIIKEYDPLTHDPFF